MALLSLIGLMIAVCAMTVLNDNSENDSPAMFVSLQEQLIYTWYAEAGNNIICKRSDNIRYALFPNGTLTVALADEGTDPPEWHLMMEGG